MAERRIGDYVAGVAAGSPWTERELLGPRDADEERVLLGLRTVEGVPLALLQRLGRSAEEGRLADLLADGFLSLRDGRVAATATGRPLLDAVLKSLLV